MLQKVQENRNFLDSAAPQTRVGHLKAGSLIRDTMERGLLGKPTRRRKRPQMLSDIATQMSPLIVPVCADVRLVPQAGSAYTICETIKALKTILICVDMNP